MKDIKDQYSKYKLTLTPLTPIFIGSGETLNKTKYYYNSAQRIINVVDEKKLINFLSRSNLIDNFSEYLLNNGNRGNLANWFNEKRININTVNIWKYQLKTGTIKDSRDPKKQLNEIKTFIKEENSLEKKLNILKTTTDLDLFFTTLKSVSYTIKDKEKFEHDFIDRCFREINFESLDELKDLYTKLKLYKQEMSLSTIKYYNKLFKYCIDEYVDK